MRYIAVIILFSFGCSNLFANCKKNELEQILFHSYDSIRVEMIKTVCEIGGIKDSAFLKEVSDGRVDSAIALRHPAIARLILHSNKKLSGTDFRQYDVAVRTIRANLMGRLMIQDFRKEGDILQKFEVHKKNLDSLFTEASDYMKALKDTTLTDFQKKYPMSKFRTLIHEKEKSKGKTTTNYLLIGLIGIIPLSLIFAMLYFAYELKKSKKALLKMQDRMKQQSDGHFEQELGSTMTRTTDNEYSQLKKQGQDKDISPHRDKEETQNESFDITKANAFFDRHDGWTIVGCSIIGNSHISMGLPCQDNNKYAYIKNGWGICITSDGAGSAKHSDIGSRIVVERGIHYFQNVIEQKKWAETNTFPTDAEWTSIAYMALKAIRTDMEKFATTKNLELSSLNATIIVVIHTPQGFLTTHVGDGRAGYKDSDGEWKAFITPHKGEEANQTIFLTSDFWNLPYYVMSGVMVPESHVVRCTPIAFTLMSDGCEHTAWQCNMKDEKTGGFFDPNKPFDRFFNPLLTDLSSGTNEDVRNRWVRFITQGNESFKREPDDKTMILGVLK